MYNYPIQNTKRHYYNASNINYWTISVFKKTEKAIKRQANHIKKNIFIFYKKNSANHTQKKSEEKVWD